jgi:hypothetical protein
MSSERRHKIEITVKGKKKTKYVSSDIYERMTGTSTKKVPALNTPVAYSKKINDFEHVLSLEGAKSVPYYVWQGVYWDGTQVYRAFPFFDKGTVEVDIQGAHPTLVNGKEAIGSVTFTIPKSLIDENDPCYTKFMKKFEQNVNYMASFFDDRSSVDLKAPLLGFKWGGLQETKNSQKLSVQFRVEAIGRDAPFQYIIGAARASVREALILSSNPVLMEYNHIYNPTVTELVFDSIFRKVIGPKYLIGEYGHLNFTRIFAEMFSKGLEVKIDELLDPVAGTFLSIGPNSMFKPDTSFDMRREIIGRILKYFRNVGIVTLSSYLNDTYSTTEQGDWILAYLRTRTSETVNYTILPRNETVISYNLPVEEQIA